MPTIEQQLNELVKQKNALATALRDKGVEAEDNETMNSLVGKVEGLDVGGDSCEFIPDISAKLSGRSVNGDEFYNNLTWFMKKIVIPEGFEFNSQTSMGSIGTTKISV